MGSSGGGSKILAALREVASSCARNKEAFNVGRKSFWRCSERMSYGLLIFSPSSKSPESAPLVAVTDSSFLGWCED